MEYPKDKENDISIFAAQPPNGSFPAHIWIRLYLINLGRSPAKDVYVKLVSVTKNEDGRSKKLTPFNPFKLRWVSGDKVTEIKIPWYGGELHGTTEQKTTNGELVKNESEYVNLCTFVGAYSYNNGELRLSPMLVPGLPEGDGHGNIVGEGHVAGMNSDLLKIIPSITMGIGNVVLYGIRLV